MTARLATAAAVAFATVAIAALAALGRACRIADDAAAVLLADDPDGAPRHPSQRLYVPAEWSGVEQ